MLKLSRTQCVCECRVSVYCFAFAYFPWSDNVCNALPAVLLCFFFFAGSVFPRCRGLHFALLLICQRYHISPSLSIRHIFFNSFLSEHSNFLYSSFLIVQTSRPYVTLPDVFLSRSSRYTNYYTYSTPTVVALLVS